VVREAEGVASVNPKPAHHAAATRASANVVGSDPADPNRGIQRDRLYSATDELHFTVHSLRHFHASALLLAGIPIAEVSARLGHANPAITMRVYAHCLRGTESKAADTISVLMRAASASGSAT
jgi:integrase